MPAIQDIFSSHTSLHFVVYWIHKTR